MPSPALRTASPSPRPWLLAAFLLVLPLLACGGPGAQADGGDAGVIADAGTAADAGTGSDAGDDAGAQVDAGTPDAGAPDAGPGVALAYVGGGGGRITAVRVDLTTGAMSVLAAWDGGSNPSYLAFHPTRRLLFAVNEASPSGLLAAFAVEADAGLTLLNRVTSSGAGPAHLAVDPSGRHVLAANYGGGTVSSVPVLADGRLGAPSDVEAPGVQPHLVAFSPDNRFVFVPCKGSDRVAQFRFDADAGTLAANTPAARATAAGAGPRHLVVHADGASAFLINELDSTTTSFRIDASGLLTPVDTRTTLPAGFTGANTGAHIALHPSGRFVYGSNRGDDSIVAYRVDPGTGALGLIGHTKTGGVRPRNFGLSLDGRLLIAANQGSNTLVAFSVDPATGALTALGQTLSVAAPAFVGFAPWP